MKKYWVVLGLMLPLVVWADQNKGISDPNVNCKEFLMSSVVVDQIKEEALQMPSTAMYDVVYHPDKDYCELTVKDKNSGKTYAFTSKNAGNFDFDDEQRIFALALYSKDKPACKNVIEADYEDVTGSFIDADYNFPCVNVED